MSTTDWEALLEAEGLGPITLSRLATPRELELCTEPYNGSVSSAYAEVAALRRAMTWLPAGDQLAIDLRCRGWTQADIGDHMVLSRRSVRVVLERAVLRVQALQDEELPDDLHHLGQLLRSSWWGRQDLRYPWRVVKNTLILVVGTWSPTAAARRHNVPKATVLDWLGMVEGADPRVAHVYDVVRRYPGRER